MPTINPSLIPTVQPGSLFSTFTETGGTLNIRWITAQDPVYYEVANRPIADVTVRQLIIAKAIDALQVRFGHQNVFPFIVQPQLDLSSSSADIPVSLIWDLHVSLPKKWQWIRLAKIKRISGHNGTGTGASSDTTDYTGKLRFIFTGQEVGSSIETALFMADYSIDSSLSFQIQGVDVVTTVEESVAIGSGESETITGNIIFRTLDVSDEDVQDFLEVVAPPLVTTTDSEGLFITPAEYEVADNEAGGASVSSDFDFSVYTHGAGMLTASAICFIPSLDSDLNTWINTFNYPFREDASLVSSSPAGITIPTGLFKEFNMIAPNNDRPTGDSTGNFFPVWISTITRNDAAADTITLYFSTFNTSDTPSTDPIAFAKLTLARVNTVGEILAIEPNDDLFPLITGSDSVGFQQGFGKGHVRLSSLWSASDGEIVDFFDSLMPYAGDSVDFTFTNTSTAVSPFGLSRVPSTIPTTSEAAALKGSTSTKETPVYPSATNRYIVESDQGAGDQIDLHDVVYGLTEHPSIEQFAYSGSLAHKTVTLVIDASKGDLDYTNDILPRLVILFGRNPIFRDEWYDGTLLRFYNGTDWVDF